jgi:hypothetical protein
MSCQIHKGRLDPVTFMPIDKRGEFILFGYRTCGLRECVNPDHHTLNIRRGRTLTGDKPEPLFKKKPDISGELLHRIAKPLLRFTEPELCQVPRCYNKHRAANLCAKHHQIWLKWRRANGIKGRVRQDYGQVAQYAWPRGVRATIKNRFCHVPDCDRAYEARGLCHLHYNRFQRVSGAKW